MLQVVWILSQRKLQQLSALFSRVTKQSQSLPTKITRLLYTSDYGFKLDNAQTVCIRFFIVSKAAQVFFQFEKHTVLLLLLIFDESDKAISQNGGEMQRLHQSPIQAIYSHQTTRLETSSGGNREGDVTSLKGFSRICLVCWPSECCSTVFFNLFIHLKNNRKTRGH